MSTIDNSVQADIQPYAATAPKFARWVSPLFKIFAEKSSAAVARHVPDGMRVYCVGDVHGRDDLLEQMAERVKADMEGQSFQQVTTVFLGDYVDRSFGSMRVLDRLSSGDWPTPIIALAGNHEDLLLTFLR